LVTKEDVSVNHKSHKKLSDHLRSL